MKRTIVSMIIASMLLATAPWQAQAAPDSSEYPGYFTLKGGYYYPSEPISLSEFNNAHFDRENGYTGEIAFGQHYGPFLGSELGIGYLQSRQFPSFGAGRTRLEAVPLLLSLKVFLPIGPIEPYGELGVGAYFNRFEVENGLGGERIFRETDFGPHVGLGVNVNFSNTFYVGLEGRYRKVKPEYEGQEVRMDGYTATMNLGFRYK